MGRLAKGSLLAALMLSMMALTAHPIAAASPQKGGSFNYSESIVVNNGQGSYTGYTDQTLISGAEQVNSVSGSTVAQAFSFSYQFSNNQGNSTSHSASGAFTWTTSDYTYVNGTDNQVGYAKPTYVWFAINPALPQGGTFYSLNTQFTVLSKNYSYHLPSQGGRYVQAVQTKGTGEYQRNDDYGTFTASYTWYEYFDPASGYIIGYSYLEQDSGQYQGQPGSFTYNDTLYVTSTSYALAAANPPSAPGFSLASLSDYVVYIGVGVIVLIILAPAAVAWRRRKGRLPKHSQVTPAPTPQRPVQPWGSGIDLGSKPPEQVVIRDIAKVNCKYCGTLIPTTADRCPYCGGPRQ
ncbi:MAG TPA: hypothetical protein VFE91_02030 [Nitrososphaerales archaeon]|nr:hypothetical protein [Nitrososphaerales archaeon]